MDIIQLGNNSTIAAPDMNTGRRDHSIVLLTRRRLLDKYSSSITDPQVDLVLHPVRVDKITTSLELEVKRMALVARAGRALPDASA